MTLPKVSYTQMKGANSQIQYAYIITCKYRTMAGLSMGAQATHLMLALQSLNRLQITAEVIRSQLPVFLRDPPLELVTHGLEQLDATIKDDF